MTPAAILQAVNADGVRLTMSPSGTLKVTGDGSAVTRWLPVIREHKPAIIDALQDGGDTGALAPEDEATIRAWLDRIEETDPKLIAETLDRCRADPGVKRFFLELAETPRVVG